MSAPVFVSYRRDDAFHAAGRLSDTLGRRFGGGFVFIDVDEIRPGDRWPARLRAALDSAQVVIAVIGPGWLAAKDVDGARRIDDPEDWVRQELEHALSSDKLVIPVLIGGAAIPPRSTLPSSLVALFDSMALKVRDEYWTSDLARLADELARHAQRATPEHLRHALLEHVALYDSRPWTRRAIKLWAEDADGRAVAANDALRQLVFDEDVGVILLAGRFGSGKTWLLRRLARDLSVSVLDGSRAAPIPIMIRLLDLASAAPRSTDELLAKAIPRPICEADLPVPVRSVFLLDGLDELVAYSQDSLDRAAAVLSVIGRLAPGGSRYVVSCRTELFAAVDVAAELLPHLSMSDPLDATDGAVKRALERGPHGVAPIYLGDVTRDQADTFLSGSKASAAWARVRGQAPYEDLTLSPVTLFLLEEALPRLTTEAADPKLPDLYRAAVDVWLGRQGVRDPSDLERLYTRLEEWAVSLLLLGLPSTSDPADEILASAGLISRDAGRYQFRHFSFVDYFLARRLVRDCGSFSSALLARLNLIGMYNVNRFAIPGLIDESESDAVVTSDDWVTARMFAALLADTRWRRGGFGQWPSLEADDGTRPFEDAPEGEPAEPASYADEIADWGATPSFAVAEAPITGVSWYDAAVFCRRAGTRLPSAAEALAGSGRRPGQPPREWTTSWYRERDGLIAVIERGPDGEPSRTIGVNPDLRAATIGFRCVRVAILDKG